MSSSDAPADPNYVAAFNHQSDGFRRVVTGFDERGKSVFVSDDRIAPLVFTTFPAGPYHKLWGGDAPPTFPDGGADPSPRAFFPSVGPDGTQGHRMWIFEIPVDGSWKGPLGAPEAVAKEYEELVPGMLQHMEPDHPGMHTTNTCDMLLVLSGSVSLELDDGVKKVTVPGDVVVENGTRHRWRNVGKVPAVVAAFIVGAHRKK